MRKPKKGIYIVAALAAPEGYEKRSRETSSLHVSVVVVKGGTGWKERAVSTRMNALPSAKGTGDYVHASVAGHVKVSGKGRRTWAYNLQEEIQNTMPGDDPMHPLRFRSSKGEVKKTFDNAVRRLRSRAGRKGKTVKIGKYTSNILKSTW